MPLNKLLQRKGQEGFTILELMIATTVFSLVLMMCLAGIMQITRMYYQGVTSIRTESVARALADEVGESIRFTKNGLELPGIVVDQSASDPEDTVQYLCIGTKRYSYLINRQLSQSPDSAQNQRRHVLWVDQPLDGCRNGAADLDLEDPSSGQGGTELLSENMRLTRFSIEPIASRDDAYKVVLSVVYGDDDLIDCDSDGDGNCSPNEPVICKTGFVGSEFCAVSNISVTVDRRL